jgi:hypothetical protein
MKGKIIWNPVLQMMQNPMTKFPPYYLYTRITIEFLHCHHVVYSFKFPQEAYFCPHIALKKHETIICILVFTLGSRKLICFLHRRSVQAAYHDKCTVKNTILLHSAISALPNEHTCRLVLPVLLNDCLCLSSELTYSTGQ